MDHVLILTALKETILEKNRNIIFLGEWCKTFDNRNFYKNFNNQTLNYHWDNRSKFFEDYKYLSELYEVILLSLSEKLNEIHNERKPLRYWRILIGPWLGNFIQIIFDRWYMINYALNNYEIFHINALSIDDLEKYIPNEMSEFESLITSDLWNNYIYLSILESLNIPHSKIKKNIKDNLVNKNEYNFKNILSLSLSKFKDIFSLFKSDKNIFIKDHYLSYFDYFKLCFNLSIKPNFFKSPKLKKYYYDLKKRNWNLDLKVTDHKYADFIFLLQELIPQNIPLIYLEGYKELKFKISNNYFLPINPRVIFSANGYYTDDFYKGWVAEKITSGTKFLAGKHGGGHGHYKWSFYQNHQYLISDLVLTYGWTNEKKKKLTNVGFFKFSPCKTRKKQKKHHTEALLIQVAFSRYSRSIQSTLVGYGQWKKYLDDQFNFVELLSKPIQERLIVRLQNNDYGLCAEEQWQNRFPQLNLSKEGKYNSYGKALKNCKIVISTYVGTTYLESLSLNIPTVIFFNPYYWELSDHAINFYEELIEAKILFLNPHSAAKHLNKYWNSVEDWWLNRTTQLARKSFCHNFANKKNNYIRELSKLISKYN